MRAEIKNIRKQQERTLTKKLNGATPLLKSTKTNSIVSLHRSPEFDLFSCSSTTRWRRYEQLRATEEKINYL